MNSRRISLQSIERNDHTTLVYNYDAGSWMSRFLAPGPLWVRYEGPVQDIPPGIAAIPFAALAAPVAWFYGGILEIPCLDREYAESLDRIKKVFQSLYPPSFLTGRVVFGSAIPSLLRNRGGTAALFTGGVDSLGAVLRHHQSDPILMSIWGSEAGISQEQAWRRMDAAQQAAADCMGLRRSVIASNYRELLLQENMSVHFPGRLKRTWYCEVAYGMILLGLCAPLAWREGVETVYIASSYTAEEGPPDGSRPSIIESIAWSGTRASCDGVHEERQVKMERILGHVGDLFPDLTLNICPMGRDEGDNCSRCDKCCVAMAGLALLGADPVRYGFAVSKETPEMIRHRLQNRIWWQSHAWQISYVQFWREIQKRTPLHTETILPGWHEFFRWLVDVDMGQLLREDHRSPKRELNRRFRRLMPHRLLAAAGKVKRRLKRQETGNGNP